MTTMLEITRRKLFEHLASIKAERKHPRLTAFFEEALEAHLEALRVERERDVMTAADLIDQRGVLRDAYEGQQMRTHNALCESRRLSDDLWEARRELASVQNDREEGHDKLQEATAKLAQQTQTIIALHRVIKDQQTAQASLQGRIEALITKRNREQAEAYAHAEEAHRHLMQAEAISDERWELLEAKQKLIVSQRKRIEQLESDLLLSSNPAKRHGFWLFWMRKSTKAKILPEKTN